MDSFLLESVVDQVNDMENISTHSHISSEVRL